MTKNYKLLLKILLLLLIMAFCKPTILNAAEQGKATVSFAKQKKKKSIKYIKKRLLKKIRNYKHCKKNKKIHVAEYELSADKESVIFTLAASQGDGVMPVGDFRVNRRTGKVKLIDDYDKMVSGIKYPKKSFKLW